MHQPHFNPTLALSALQPHFSHAPTPLTKVHFPKCTYESPLSKVHLRKSTLAMHQDHSQIRSLSISSTCDWFFCSGEWALREVWGSLKAHSPLTFPPFMA